MAIKPRDRYPGQVDISDPDYPGGKARNIVSEGDGTGTPLEKDLVNDLFGLQQALLAAAGIVQSGTPDTAVNSQYLLSFYRLMGRVDGWGALGDDSADDTTAIQAALNAVSAYGSGRQWLRGVPGKVYRVTGLTVPANVDIDWQGASVKNTHASNHLFTYTGAGGRVAQQLRNGFFGAVNPNTGATVSVNSAAKSLLAFGCHFGATTNVNGKHIAIANATRVEAQNCIFIGRADVSLVDVTANNCKLVLTNCDLDVPETYTSSVVKHGGSGGVVGISRCRYNLVSHGAGVMACIEITGTNKRCWFEANDFLAGANHFNATAYKWDSAIVVREQDTVFGPLGVAAVTPYVGPLLAVGSELSLLPHGSATVSDEAYTLPNDYSAFSAKVDSNLPANWQMPAIRFPGQEFVLDVENETGASWLSSYFLLNAIGPGIADKDPSGQFITGHKKTALFKVMFNHFLNGYRWTLIGDWLPRTPRAQTVGA